MSTPYEPFSDQPPYPASSTITVASGPVPESQIPPLPPRRYRTRPRRVLLPALLFVATCVATFWAGSNPSIQIMRHDFVNQVFPGFGGGADGIMLIGRWHDGLVYMMAVMGILLAHEMGHFIQAVRYGVPASLPFFIPMPFTPLGTMGAVIGMQGSEADRKELFDIGLSGPLAGLVVALPIAWIGIQQAQPFPMNAPSGIHFQDPLLFRVLMQKLHPELLPGQELTMNPLLMAGWVGMLITGLNMLPISQLDGGHVSYALFGKGSFWLARAVVVAAVAFMLISGVYGWMVMLLLVTMIGVQHPPTANDRVELGWGRRLLGLASLAIPVLCLAPNPISAIGN
ncbi:MAG TPA: site-2 protease family protein [Pirellulales bacterium]|nr:site-2 protease family protein [Pirellulales bacterium]